MSITIDRKFTDRGRHYRLEVTEDATVRLRLRCQRRWYVVASARLPRRGLTVAAFPSEVRGIVKELLTEYRGRAAESDARLAA